MQGERYKQALRAAGNDPQAIQAVKNQHLIYRNSFDTIKKIYVNEGAKGLQKGLTPAILREGSKNLFRIVSVFKRECG